MTTFVGKAGVSTFQAIALKHGLKLYAKTGMKPNRAWTPSAMMKLAQHITGVRIKARDYQKAIDELDHWIEVNGTTGQ